MRKHARREAEYDGAIGSFVTKLFEISVGGAGLSLNRGQREGFDAISARVIQFDRTHYYPEKDLMVLEIVVEKKSARVLGIQGLGDKGDGMVGWKNIPQEAFNGRILEIPPDRPVVLICNTGMRSYEAQVMLDHAGINTTYNLPGGWRHSRNGVWLFRR